MRVSWGASPPGVMFAAEVETCSRQGRQFWNSPSTRAGTPCRVFPVEGKQGGHSRAVYGGGEVPTTERAVLNNQGAHGKTDRGTKQKGKARREVVMITDEEPSQPSFQMRIRAEPMTEQQRSEARNAYRAAEGFETGDNEGEQPGDRDRSQEQGVSTGQE